MCESESRSLSLDKIILKLKFILALSSTLWSEKSVAFWLQTKAVFWTISFSLLSNQTRTTQPSTEERMSQHLQWLLSPPTPRFPGSETTTALPCDAGLWPQPELKPN